MALDDLAGENKTPFDLAFGTRVADVREILRANDFGVTPKRGSGLTTIRSRETPFVPEGESFRLASAATSQRSMEVV